MAKKIIKVEDEPKTKKKVNIDFKKIGKVIYENRETIEAVADVILNSSKKKKRTTTKNGTSKKKTTSKSKSNNVDVTDIIGSLLKK